MKNFCLPFVLDFFGVTNTFSEFFFVHTAAKDGKTCFPTHHRQYCAFERKKNEIDKTQTEQMMSTIQLREQN